MPESLKVDDARIGAIDPSRFAEYLIRNGWRLVGRMTGAYERFSPPGEDGARRGNVVVPLDRENPEFVPMMRAAVTVVTSSSRREGDFLSVVLTERADQFQFQKETGTPSGFIQWSRGEQMFAHARSMLLVGAKSFIDKAPYFANRLGKFARRYLDSALMGQTESGSYIINAYVPPDAEIALQGQRREIPDLYGTTSVQSGAISRSIAASFEATAEALEHYHLRRSYEGFERHVTDGISFELLHALAGLVEDSEGVRIAVDIADGTERRLHRAYEYRAFDSPILRDAGNRLLEDSPAQAVTVIGRVHFLKKERFWSTGVLGIEWASPAGKRRMRVKLARNSDYAVAVQSHLEGRPVQFSGALKRQGRQYILDDALLDEVFEPTDEVAIELSSTGDLLF